MAPKPGRATEASKVVKGLPYLQGPLPNEEQSHGGWEWLSPKMARAEGEEESLTRAGGHPGRRVLKRGLQNGQVYGTGWAEEAAGKAVGARGEGPSVPGQGAGPYAGDREGFKAGVLWPHPVPFR